MKYDLFPKINSKIFGSQNSLAIFYKQYDQAPRSLLLSIVGDKKSKRFMMQVFPPFLSVSNNSVNLSSTVSANLDASAYPGFYNYSGSSFFGNTIDGVSISRVYNRSTLPIDNNVFFSTGLMGGSNGKVIPTIPLEWTYNKNKLGAKGLTYLVKIIKDGTKDTAKFKVTKWPYINMPTVMDSFLFNKKHSFEGVTIPFSEIIPAAEISGGYSIGFETKTLPGIHFETRIKSDNTSIILLLVNSQKLQILDEDFDTVLKELALSVAIQSFTFANGKIYALGEDQQIYIVDQTTGVCNPISGCQLSGTHKGIMADHSQGKVYAGTSDGKILVLSSVDDSFTIYEDVGFNLEAKNYNGIGFDAYNNVYFNGNQKISFSPNPSLGAVLPGIVCWNIRSYIRTGYVSSSLYIYLTIYDLDGNILFENKVYIGERHTIFKTIYGAIIAGWQYASFGHDYFSYQALWGIIPFHPDDISLWRQNKGETKKWKAWNGTTWVEEDVTDEVPTGAIDSTNKVYVLDNPIEPGTISITVDGSATPITDDENGVLSDTGTVDYATKTIILNSAPTTSITVTYKIDGQLTGDDVEIEDGIHLQFQDGTSTPHFAKDEYFSFLVGEGFVKDNMQTAFSSLSMHVVPTNQVIDETFTISSTEMYAAGQSQTGFMRVDSSIGLSAKIAGTDATIITTGDPAAGQIFVDYASGLLKFNSADTGKVITEMKYVWLQRPQ